MEPEKKSQQLKDFDVIEREQAEAKLEECRVMTDAILDSLKSRLVVIDRDGCITAANVAWKEAWQTGAAAHTNWVGVNYLTECARAADTGDELAARALRGINDVLDGTAADFSLEYPCDTPTGRLWFVMTVTPLRGRSGGVVIAHDDTTERKQAEAKREEADRLLDSVLENLPAVVFLKRASDLRFERLNRAGEMLLGYPRSALIGKTDYDFFPREQADFFTTVDREVLVDGGVREIEEEPVLTANGQERYLHTSKIALRDASGAASHLLGVSIDITERKAAEDQLRASEERYRGIFQNAATGIAITDLDGRLQSCNPAFAAMLGYTEAELRDMACPGLVHPDDREDNLVRIRRLLAEEIPSFEMLNRYVAKSGAVRWADRHVSLLRDAAGRPNSIIVLVTDITERKAVEDRLRASEERYRGIFQNAATGIAITDLDGRFQSCNPAYAAMLGYTEAELRNMVYADLLHPEDREDTMAEIGRLVGEEISSFEILNRYLAKSGAALWAHRHVSLLRDAAGRPTHLIALVTDMSERKLHEERIQFLMREVNHRSKNMLALVQAIARETAATGVENFAERFDERVQALAAAQDLLVRNEWRAVPLGDLVRSQLSHFAEIIGTRISITGPPLRLTPAATQTLGMALHELATNAAKYGALSNDTGSVSISWDLQADEGAEPWLTLSWVEKEGPAVHKPAQRGFGAMVTRDMVEFSLAAEVATDYAPDGLKWHFACAAGRVLEGQPAPPRIEAANARGAGPARRSTGHRVLVVEDEPLIATEMAATLAQVGLEVIGPAGTVKQALTLLERHGCDAAVLDVNLGAETSEAVARELIGSGTPFVVVSGYAREQLPVTFGTAPFLGKPLKPAALQTLVKRCLEQQSELP